MQADDKSDIDNHITALLNDILAPTNDAELRGVLKTVDVLTDFVELDNVRSILADDVLFRENRELALIAFDILRKMHDRRPNGGPARAENVGNEINEIEATMTAVMGGAIAEAPEPAESAPDEAVPKIAAEAIAAASAGDVVETPAIGGMGAVAEAPEPTESKLGLFEAVSAESMPNETVSEVMSAPPGLAESESEMFDAADVEPPPDETVSEVMDEVIMTSDVGEVAETRAIESIGAMAEFPESAESELLEAAPVESMPDEAAAGVPEEAIAAVGAGDVVETPAIEGMGGVAKAPEPVESESKVSEVAPVESMSGKSVTEIVGAVIGAADAGEIAETPESVESMPNEAVSEVMEEAIAASNVGEIVETPAIEGMCDMAEFPEPAESEMLEATPVESMPDETVSEVMDAPPGLAESESEMFWAADIESVPEESPPEFKLSAPEISTIIEIPELGSEEPEPKSLDPTPEFPGFSEDRTDMPDMADPESPDFPGISEDSPFPDDGTATSDMAGALTETESPESTPDFPGFSEDDSLSDDAPFPGASPDTPDMPDTGGGSERTWELTLGRIKELKNKYVNKL